MQKIKTFIRTFWLSCTSPKYYAQIIKAPFSFSLKYLLVFQFITTFVIAAAILIPLSQLNVLGILDSVKNIYPQDLEVQVQDGKLSINQPLPYRVELPNVMENQMAPTRWVNDDGDIKYVVVFDSDKNIQGAADVYAEDAFVVITETTIYSRQGENEGLRVNTIPDSDDFELNQGMVDQSFSKITSSKFVQQKLYVPLLGAFFILIVLPIMIVASLIMVAVYGFFVWLMTRILKSWMMAGQLLPYGKAVQVSIHSLTLINVLHFGLNFTGYGDLLEGGKFLLAFLVWTGFVLFQSFHMRGGAKPVTTTKASVTAKSRKPAKKSRK